MRKTLSSGNGSLMIRMIDVVFILLFGFIAVSQISQAEAVEPPKSQEAMMKAPEGPDIVIVGIRGKNVYSVEGGEKVFRQLHRLESYLKNASRRAKQGKRDFQVRIRAGWDAPVQDALKVANMCRDLGYVKGIDVVRVES